MIRSHTLERVQKKSPSYKLGDLCIRDRRNSRLFPSCLTQPLV
ncbi:hypothetical protein VIBHAR_04958 [Vibrio campbellii ATCC BAA-1116]|uniref:Uncharacterized protein n=1 Tax=Vibrio campbellii (strain ATCC BAA-1116) TaxID=2902295 RepID=A7N784_VIBC1|nr:hypothetical protein VIBHAR_04958 [Vibrio campbellii ATCC BAA-1116]